MIFYAPNIHQGGGKVLLHSLLKEMKGDQNILFVLDERLNLPAGLTLSGKIIRVKATILSRLFLEWRLRRLISPETKLLCMGNLPPLFSNSENTTVFVQNRYLIDDVPLDGFSWFTRLRISVERLWLRSRSSCVKRFLVQTPTMRQLLKKALGRDSDVLPFVSSTLFCNKSGKVKGNKLYDFLYVASGEPHKNHQVLIEAWKILARRNSYPSLCLTLEKKRFPQLCTWIESMVEKHHLQVTFSGRMDQNGISRLYKLSRALIYPSRFESFGIPLLEGAAAGLPILASNVDYVRDVVRPTMVFDPESAPSIADAVLDFSYEPASLAVDPLDARAFIDHLVFAI